MSEKGRRTTKRCTLDHRIKHLWGIGKEKFDCPSGEKQVLGKEGENVES